ncbi:MaoC family dehydratase [Sheuella amnicola]|nr:MaoC family dehydratase [Sheuella amnicola]
MIQINTVSDMEKHVGQELGVSDWLLIDQKRIDEFARATGDEHWIHVDVERAAKELPDGKTIAHGFLTLSLITPFAAQISPVLEHVNILNYGSDKVRFTSPVKAGDRVRMKRTLVKFENLEKGKRLTFANTIEIEGQERPALYAETISLIFN